MHGCSTLGLHNPHDLQGTSLDVSFMQRSRIHLQGCCMLFRPYQTCSFEHTSVKAAISCHCYKKCSPSSIIRSCCYPACIQLPLWRYLPQIAFCRAALSLQVACCTNTCNPVHFMTNLNIGLCIAGPPGLSPYTMHWPHIALKTHKCRACAKLCGP